jgi:L-fucose mutarotase
MSVINSGKSRGFVKTTRLRCSTLFSMLKNIPPLLTPDALHALASMGHGDDVAIVDANFPAAQVAHKSGARLVQLAGATAPAGAGGGAAAAAAGRLCARRRLDHAGVGDAAAVPAPVAEFATVLHQAGERPAVPLERFDFYARAQAAFLILQTGEQRKYGNILLRKGVISSDAR